MDGGVTDGAVIPMFDSSSIQKETRTQGSWRASQVKSIDLVSMSNCPCLEQLALISGLRVPAQQGVGRVRRASVDDLYE
jgi:hypothetical protein